MARVIYPDPCPSEPTVPAAWLRDCNPSGTVAKAIPVLAVQPETLPNRAHPANCPVPSSCLPVSPPPSQGTICRCLVTHYLRPTSAVWIDPR